MDPILPILSILGYWASILGSSGGPGNWIPTRFHIELETNRNVLQYGQSSDISGFHGDSVRSLLPRAFLWALVMGPFDSGGVCSMGPCFEYGTQWVFMVVQISGPYSGPIGKSLDY